MALRMIWENDPELLFVTSEGTQLPLPDKHMQEVFNWAIDISVERRHGFVGTEHILAGLDMLHKDEPKLPLFVFLRKQLADVPLLMRTMKDRSLWDKRAKDEVTQISDGVCRVFDVVGRIVKNTGATALTCDLFVMSAVIEATTVMAEVIGSRSRGRLSPVRACRFVGAGVDVLGPKEGVSFEVRTVQGKFISKREVRKTLVPWSPSADTLEIEKYKTPPPVPHATNWVVYPNLLIGGTPNNWDARDLDALVHGEGLDPGRDVIVCLMGEAGRMVDYMKYSYVPKLERQILSSGESIDVVYLPIHDFDVVPLEQLKDLIIELKRRLLAGQHMYIHCRGGHGRTGLVVIPLVAALFHISVSRSAKWINKTYRASERGEMWRWKLPETEEQMELAEQLGSMLRRS